MKFTVYRIIYNRAEQIEAIEDEYFSDDLVENASKVLLSQDVNEVLNDLDEDEAQIIRKRFGIDEDYQEDLTGREK